LIAFKKIFLEQGHIIELIVAPLFGATVLVLFLFWLLLTLLSEKVYRFIKILF